MSTRSTVYTHNGVTLEITFDEGLGCYEGRFRKDGKKAWVIGTNEQELLGKFRDLVDGNEGEDCYFHHEVSHRDYVSVLTNWVEHHDTLN